MTGKQSGNGGRSLGFSPLEEVGGGGILSPEKGTRVVGVALRYWDLKSKLCQNWIRTIE